jgi:hypothetical protein
MDRYRKEQPLMTKKPKNKTLSMLTRPPKNFEQLRFRTHMRLGALAIAGLLVWLLVQFWYVAVVIAAIAMVVLVLKKRGR